MRLTLRRGLVAAGCLLAAVACGGAPAPASTPAARPAATVPTTAPVAVAPPTAPVAADPTAPPAPASVQLARVQGLGNVVQLGVVRGYFEEQGLELQRHDFPTGADAMPALSTGELDVGSIPPNPFFFNALARGIRLALALDSSHIARGGRAMPLMSRLAGGVPVVRDVADLRGKRLAHSQPGVISEPALAAMMAEVGLGEDALGDKVYLPLVEQLAAFGGGAVDAAVTGEPFGTIAEDRGLATRIGEAGDFVPGAQVSMIIYSERFARERADVGRRFAIAYLRCVRDYMDAFELGRDRESTLGILAETARVEPRILDQAGYFAIRRDGRVNLEALSVYLDWLADHGYVPQRPNLAALVDNQFADHAARTLQSGR